MTGRDDEELLLDLLNTTPVVDGAPTDRLADAEAGRSWLAAHGVTGTQGEWRTVRAARDTLQDVVRGASPASALAPFVSGVRRHASFADGAVTWELHTPPDGDAAARAVLAWDRLRAERPGRLRPCANPDCRLFLIDRSKPNTARWCSMASCGNRMKARRHYRRTRDLGSE
ncbi:CGNR zinc finger domain-containing protein [Streptomyces sp. NPDC003717]|uniref:CGNR zinc finger domain-containing protein n=1 Tax=Streptomyces sp. NPDC003717 TaxID=3154276 RepID=UPI0033A81BCB